MTYGNTKNPIAQAEYIVESTQIAMAMDACRYCKVARNKVQEKADAAEAQTGAIADIAPHRPDYWAGEVARAGCKAHKQTRKLAYLTSPVSETYWAS